MKKGYDGRTVEYNISEAVRGNLSTVALEKLEVMSYNQRQDVSLADIEILCEMEKAAKEELERIVKLKQNWKNRAESLLSKK